MQCLARYSGVNFFTLPLQPGLQDVAAAFSLARKIAPCIVFVDNVDSLLPTRDGPTALPFPTRAFMANFFIAWDLVIGKGIGSPGSSAGVQVVATTTSPAAIDPAALRWLPWMLEMPLAEEQAL